MQVIYEDNHIIIVNKESGEIVQGDKTGDKPLSDIVKEYLKEKYQKPGEVFLGVVHRLDRPVGGLMVFARTSKAAARLSAQMREHEMGREYLCVTEGQVKDKFTLINYLIQNERMNRVMVCDADERGAQEAILHGHCLARKSGLSLCSLRLETGRKHQIRVQMKEMGAPLWGDHRYGHGIPGQQIALWGYKLTFEHPTTKSIMTFQHLPCGSVWNGFADELTDMAIRFANSAATILKPEERPTPAQPAAENAPAPMEVPNE